MKRKNEITLLNVLLCLTVIFIHVSSEPVTARDSMRMGLWLAVFTPWRMAAFVVPGFIMLSGIKLFLKGTDGFSAASFYRSRLSSVVLPYLLWAVIYYAYYCLTGQREFHLTDLIYNLITGDLAGHFYFVVALSQLYALMPLWVRLFQKTNPIFMLPASLMISILFGQYLPNLVDLWVPGYYFRFSDRMFTTYFFWWTLGAYIGLYYETFTAALKKSGGVIVCIFLMGLAVDGVGSYLRFVQDRPILWLENAHMFYCIGILMLLYRVALALKDTRFAQARLIQGIDRTSYWIYLIHCLILAEVNRLMNLAELESLRLRYGIRITAVYVGTIALCLLWKRFTPFRGLMLKKCSCNGEATNERE